jgi:hypothetical protein
MVDVVVGGGIQRHYQKEAVICVVFWRLVSQFDFLLLVLSKNCKATESIKSKEANLDRKR